MWMEPLDQADSVLTALSLTIAGGFTALFLLRSRHRTIAERMKQSLEKHQDYFTYLSANMHGADALFPPPGRLTPVELKAIQSKLLQWIERSTASSGASLPPFAGIWDLWSWSVSGCAAPGTGYAWKPLIIWVSCGRPNVPVNC